MTGHIFIQVPVCARSSVKAIVIIIFIFFNVPFQDYLSSYEMGQSVGGAKTGVPREKPPGTPASRTWLVSRGQCGARTYTRHSGETIELLRDRALNRSATGAASTSV